MKRARLLVVSLFVPALALTMLAASPEKPDRDSAKKLMADGNFKEACDGFSALALDLADDPALAGGDLTNAVECLKKLNRINEFDALIEKVILAHKDNGLLLFAAAENYLAADHYGSIVAGNFVRGQPRDRAARAGSSSCSRKRSSASAATAKPGACSP
jgi:hypothetical protein